jgi:tetratricopeptide (TPR) repeat protein
MKSFSLLIITTFFVIGGCANGPSEDLMIGRLETELRKQPNSAEICLYLASLYQNKKNYSEAEKYFLKAGNLDQQYACSIFPMYDEQHRWDEIIKLADRYSPSANAEPSVIGPLATAYREKGRLKESNELIEILDRQRETGGKADYRNYVLAYACLWKGDIDGSLEKLSLIKEPYYRRFARTSWKFAVLKKHPKFIYLTKDEEPEKN